MSECVEIFQALKEKRKEESKTLLAYNMERLEATGIPYTVHNDGYHIVLDHVGRKADFWPSTGKYRVRANGRYRRGWKGLMRDLEYSSEPE